MCEMRISPTRRAIPFYENEPSADTLDPSGAARLHAEAAEIGAGASWQRGEVSRQLRLAALVLDLQREGVAGGAVLMHRALAQQLGRGLVTRSRSGEKYSPPGSLTRSASTASSLRVDCSRAPSHASISSSGLPAPMSSLVASWQRAAGAAPAPRACSRFGAARGGATG